MTQQTTADESTELKEVDADALFNILSAQAESETQMLPEAARLKICVQYNPSKGTKAKSDTLTKSGEVWGVYDGQFQDEIKFSANVGQDDEDSYILKIRANSVEIVSFSDRGNKTELGRVQSVEVQQ